MDCYIEWSENNRLKIPPYYIFYVHMYVHLFIMCIYIIQAFSLLEFTPYTEHPAWPLNQAHCDPLDHSWPRSTSRLVISIMHLNVGPFFTSFQKNFHQWYSDAVDHILSVSVMDNTSSGAAFFIPKVSLLLFSEPVGYVGTKTLEFSRNSHC